MPVPIALVSLIAVAVVPAVMFTAMPATIVIVVAVIMIPATAAMFVAATAARASVVVLGDRRHAEGQSNREKRRKQKFHHVTLPFCRPT